MSGLLSLLLALPFYVGETLTFRVKYTFLNVGKMTLTIDGREQMNGYETYKARLVAKGGIPGYRIDDEISSWFSVDNLATVYYHKRIHEGSYRAEAKISYDPSAGKATYEDGETYDTPAGAVDPLVVFYYVRSLDLEVGKSYEVPYHVDRRSEMMSIKCVGVEKVKAPYGTFECFKLVSNPTSGKNVFGQDGGVTLWISNDESRLPVRVETKMFFGSMAAFLESKS